MLCRVQLLFHSMLQKVYGYIIQTTFNLKIFDERIDTFKQWLKESTINIDSVCACGSIPMGLFDLREPQDFDFLHSDNKVPKTMHNYISSHEEECKYYPKHKNEIIYNPQNHFYYRGIKFISIETIWDVHLKSEVS